MRIVDQLDNLYLLKDPVLPNGEIEPITDFNERQFAEYSTSSLPLEDHGVVFPALISNQCPQELLDLVAELESLAESISMAFTYETYIK